MISICDHGFINDREAGTFRYHSAQKNIHRVEVETKSAEKKTRNAENLRNFIFLDSLFSATYC